MGLWGRVSEGSCLSISVPRQVMEKEEKKNGRSARPRVAKVRERFLNKDISSVLFFQCQKHTSPLSIESKPHFLSSFLNVFLLQDNVSYFFWKG